MKSIFIPPGEIGKYMKLFCSYSISGPSSVYMKLRVDGGLVGQVNQSGTEAGIRAEVVRGEGIAWVGIFDAPFLTSGTYFFADASDGITVSLVVQTLSNGPYSIGCSELIVIYDKD